MQSQKQINRDEKGSQQNMKNKEQSMKVDEILWDRDRI